MYDFVLGQGPTPIPVQCSSGQFSCLVDGLKKCLPNEWKCDGYTDCEDGKDEVGCPTQHPITHTTPNQNIGDCRDDQASVQNLTFVIASKYLIKIVFGFCFGSEFLCVHVL